MINRRKSAIKYKHSEKGILSNQRYLHSEYGKAAKQRYAQSEKGKIARDRYKKSNKGFASRIKYQQSIRGRMNSLLSSARCRARRCKLPCTITIDDLLQKVEATNYCCDVTGMKLDFSVRGGRKKNHRGPSLDQKIPAAGYTKENVQIVSVWFNHMKGDMSTEEALAILHDWKEADKKTGNALFTILHIR